MKGLTIGGVTPLSTLDFPDALAAVIYCQGCPWGCPYCHNEPLREITDRTERDGASVLAWLAGRRGLLDAVVFSGGEPTLQEGLGGMLGAVRDLGFKVGLHTTGMFPQALERVLPLCDWVGLDIKAPRADYARVTGVAGSGEAAFASLALLLASHLPFETRTTWHPGLLSEAALVALARELAEAGAGRWVIQAFRPDGCADPDLAAAGPTAFPPDLVSRLLAVAPRLTITTRS
ncbi:anaerobic ribonucleoside-triphosphate reductase activating protein [Solidesulfovibrio carbinoliphilus subsp. oakridgensis]|uniref:Anaerobic ribonucleoside-triphosphate reductase activating protein n=1 Tax=Solidesulfovibrio carbinoliphilus subsp. oakridgensis TaxID=694327 RepID=G7QAK7_9BACT|nr:anaerobic ribonucleoside-triphosphate reductase activating protein [Solidesulfovibrio carbinoliphilus]EHJ48760.1 anaerobic ribonucleoside-triphosphate reductase activating protein [Solidesulfovibrio carbinoliphilus subsp. oakridgensis]